MKVNSHNEWDKLKEIIVGHAEVQASLILSHLKSLSVGDLEKVEKLSSQAYPQWLMDEIHEDLEELCNVLKKAGVKVYRPDTSHLKEIYTTPYFGARGEHIYNMRDLHLVVGDRVIEGSSQERHRYFEAMGLYQIWYTYLKEGGIRWISAPKPKLPGDHMIPYYENGQRHFKLYEEEILFEPANTVRMGRDLLYLVSRSGNYLGAKWLKSILGDEYNIHTTEEIYKASHIDSTVIALRPGLVLLCAERVDSQNCPKIFNKWEKVYFEDILPTPPETLEFHEKVRKKIYHELLELGVQTNLEGLSSKWIGMNVLSLDPSTVIVDKRQVLLMKTLEKYKMTPIPISFRHSYLMGGIHCSTLDTVRESRLESYFDKRTEGDNGNSHREDS